MNAKTHVPCIAVAMTVGDAASGDVTRNLLRWEPVSAQLDSWITSAKDGKDTISGWKIQSAAAKEHGYVPIDWNKLSGNSGPMRSYMVRTASI